VIGSVALHVAVVLVAWFVHRATSSPSSSWRTKSRWWRSLTRISEDFALPEPDDLVIETPEDPLRRNPSRSPSLRFPTPSPIPEPDPIPPPDPIPDPPWTPTRRAGSSDGSPREPPVETPPPRPTTADVASQDINIRMEGLQRDFPAYYAEIQAAVARCFREPPGVRGVTAVLRFEIQRDGSIPGRSIRVHRPSGNSRFDIAAVGAVECAGPAGWAPFHRNFPVDALQVEFRFSPRGNEE
jgi:outer membrane biosynthesis protein TonB